MPKLRRKLLNLLTVHPAPAGGRAERSTRSTKGTMKIKSAHCYTVCARNSLGQWLYLLDNSNGRTMCPNAQSIAYRFESLGAARKAMLVMRGEWKGLDYWTVERD